MNHANQDEIERALGLLHPAGDPIELRIIGGGPVLSGVFSEHRELAAHAAGRSGTVPGIYITLNPLTPRDGLVTNTLRPSKRCVKDSDILRRRWLPVDFDPVRPAGTSASESEHQYAIQRARECATELQNEGWAAPIVASSGNGAHVLFPIDLPNDVPSGVLVREVLAGFSVRFSDDQLVVDQTPASAGQIWKLYGTQAAKGEPTADRPHRLSEILESPTSRGLVTVEQLTANAVRMEWSKGTGMAQWLRTPEDVDEWLSTVGVSTKKSAWEHGGTKWVFDVCPSNPAHMNRSAYIAQKASGQLSAGCKHQSCFKGITELFQLFGREMPHTSSPSPSSARIQSGLRLIKLKDVVEADVEWVWPSFVPKGAITGITGDPGVGKSYLALYLASMISQGLELGADGGTRGRGRKRNVIYCAAEDGLATVVRKRLTAMGADGEFVNLVAPATLSSFTAQALETLLPSLEPALIVIDTLTAVLPPGIDANNASEARSFMQPFVDLAQRHNLAIVVVRHLRKSDGRGVHSALGSIDFTAVCRSEIQVRDSSNSEVRVVEVVKSNVAPRGTKLAYQIEGSRLVFVDIQKARPSSPKINATETARRFLRQELSGGPKRSTEIQDAAAKNKVSKNALERAKRDLEIVVSRKAKYWEWSLPDAEPKDVIDEPQEVVDDPQEVKDAREVAKAASVH